MLRKGTFILMKTKIQDMTSGSPGRLIILFAIPLMLGNICQQLYTIGGYHGCWTGCRCGGSCRTGCC